MVNIREALEAKGFDKETIREAMQNAEDLRVAGYADETVESLCEAYLEEGNVIEGEFTLEKLMMAVDPDQAFVDFWEGTNA